MKRLLLVAALLAGCGTTVPLAQQSSLQTGGGLAAPGTAPSYAAGGSTGGTAPTGTTGATALGGAPATSATTGGTTGATIGGGGSPSLQRAGGSVQIGFFVIKDLGPATKALGVDGLSTGDAAKQVAASLAILNSRGGIDGRTVKPVVFQVDATQDAQTQYQAACGMFFDDNKVSAVVGAIINTTVQTCAQQHGAPYLTSGNRTTSTNELAHYPGLVLPSQFDVARVVASQVQSLKAQGWFAPRTATEQVKVGLLYNEDPDYAQVPSLVEAQLKRIGLTLADKQSMPGTDDTSRVAGASSAGSNAVLRFSASQITHVLVIDKSGQAIAYFGLAAQNQGYYPAFGLSSLELPASLRTVLSKRQLEGAKGIGWMPAWDTPVAKQPALTANGTSCVNALRKAGEDVSLAATRGSALAICDSTLLLGPAWKGQPLTAAGFLTGLRALRTGWPPVMSFATDFTSRRDGASGLRPMAFQDACDCFAYTGPLTGASS